MMLLQLIFYLAISNRENDLFVRTHDTSISIIAVDVYGLHGANEPNSHAFFTLF